MKSALPSTFGWWVVHSVSRGATSTIALARTRAPCVSQASISAATQFMRGTLLHTAIRRKHACSHRHLPVCVVQMQFVQNVSPKLRECKQPRTNVQYKLRLLVIAHPLMLRLTHRLACSYCKAKQLRLDCSWWGCCGQRCGRQLGIR